MTNEKWSECYICNDSIPPGDAITIHDTAKAHDPVDMCNDCYDWSTGMDWTPLEPEEPGL